MAAAKYFDSRVSGHVTISPGWASAPTAACISPPDRAAGRRPRTGALASFDQAAGASKRLRRYRAGSRAITSMATAMALRPGRAIMCLGPIRKMSVAEFSPAIIANPPPIAPAVGFGGGADLDHWRARRGVPARQHRPRECRLSARRRNIGWIDTPSQATRADSKTSWDGHNNGLLGTYLAIFHVLRVCENSETLKFQGWSVPSGP
jgi:hypothetical protein